jgi:hypothetical protein
MQQSLKFAWDRQEFLAHMKPLSAFQAYFESFSPMDIQVRRPSGVYSTETYLRALVPRSAMPSDLPASFQRDVRSAERRLGRLAFGLREGDALKSMVAKSEQDPWVLAFVEDRTEGGMPHTHGGVICLPFRWALMGLGSPAFIQTLIHERIHVLQRRYPHLGQKLAYQRLRVRPAMQRRDLEPFLKAQWRTNPDLDSFVYSDGVIALFDKDAEKLGDIRLISLFKRGLPTIKIGQSSAKSEHPFETIAYTVAEDAMTNSASGRIWRR